MIPAGAECYMQCAAPYSGRHRGPCGNCIEACHNDVVSGAVALSLRINDHALSWYPSVDKLRAHTGASAPNAWGLGYRAAGDSNMQLPGLQLLVPFLSLEVRFSVTLPCNGKHRPPMTAPPGLKLVVPFIDRARCLPLPLLSIHPEQRNPGKPIPPFLLGGRQGRVPFVLNRHRGFLCFGSRRAKTIRSCLCSFTPTHPVTHNVLPWGLFVWAGSKD